MKRLFALMLALVLALSALPAAAEELYTFAGIPWSTPKSWFLEVAGEKKLPFQEFSSDRYSSSVPAFVLEEGYYSVLGIPVAVSYNEAGVYYQLTGIMWEGENDAAFALDRLEFEGMPQPLRGDLAEGEIRLEDMQLAQDVIDQVIGRYGEPDWVQVDDDWLVPAEEYPYIARDAVAFTAMDEYGDDCTITCGFRNVELEIEVELPELEDEYEPGEYIITLTYHSGLMEAPDEDDMESFPMANGEITYIVIEP